MKKVSLPSSANSKMKLCLITRTHIHTYKYGERDIETVDIETNTAWGQSF